MPDIMMCASKNCTKRENCYRFTAIPNDFQSYADFEEDCMNFSHRNQLELSGNEIVVSDICNLLARN